MDFQIIFFLVLIIFFIIIYSAKRKAKFEKIAFAKPEVVKANRKFTKFLNQDEYFNNKKFIKWKEQFKSLKYLFQFDYHESDHDKVGVLELKEFENYYNNGRRLIDDKNSNYILSEIESNKTLFDTIEAYPLNNEQKEAIVVNEDNNLIIAGAGTGKTSTLLGKVVYLINNKKCKPDEILILAFTKKVAEEIKTRIKEKTNIELKVRTFHSFGLEVIGLAQNGVPSVAFENKTSLSKFILKEFNRLKKNDLFLSNVINYLLYHVKPYKSQHSFDNPGDYFSYLKSNSYQSILGEQLKSLDEIQIANFLFENSIKYEYERDYEYCTVSKQYRQYKPDFFLPDYNIYIEHFGIDRDGNPPEWFSPTYVYGMEWKRELHKTKNTTLIETYSYEQYEGNLLTNLEIKLKENGVKLKKRPINEIINKFEKKKQKEIPSLIKLIITFLNLMRSNNFSINTIIEKSKNNKQSKRINAFLRVFNPIYEQYEKHLDINGLVDFSDMISLATEHITNNRYQSNFSYILIDEFQDISSGRYKLIRSLLEQNHNQRLFCVGDDWQSIYRFTGSDLSYITNFEDFFGYTKRIDLNISYRLTNKIAKISSEFILKNPIQLRKSLNTLKEKETNDKVCCIISSTDVDRPKTLVNILEKIQVKVRQKSQIASVLIIVRYNFNILKDLYKIFKRFNCLQIEYVTAHRSKGLEADYVIVDNVVNGKYGFPSQINDDPIINLLLAKPDVYENAEERRLFYVAITRAKIKTFITTDKFNRSSFLEEIDENQDENIKCDWCKTGDMLVKQGKYGKFYSCSNYPFCKYSMDYEKQ